MAASRKQAGVARRTNRRPNGVCLGPADSGLRVSRLRFAISTFEEPWRYERVEGRLIVMPPAGHDHATTNEPIRDYLGAYKLAHPKIVELVVSEAWIRIDEQTDRIADIAVYLVSKTKPPRIPDRVPELVFEIASGGRDDQERDYVRKRAEYHRIGVREYVIADRLAGRATVLRWRKNGYAETILGPKDTYTTKLLPGLEIPLTTALAPGGEG